MIDIEQEAERILSYDNLCPRMLALEIKDLINRIEEENKKLVWDFKMELEKAKCDVRGAYL